MNEIILLSSILVPLTTAFTEVVKKATGIKGKYVPLLAIILGVFLGGLATFTDLEIYARLWGGAISGLASVGLFEIGKDKKGVI